jgi:DNA-binding MarR family transcriptional regulator
VAEETEWFDEVAFPALLRAARTTYGAAIREDLGRVGCDDLPRNGAYVIGGIARTGAPLSEIITGLGVSKQAAGQLVDALVTRGYLARAVDPDDRRRLTITLTDRGHAAAVVIRSAVDRVDADLERRVGPQYVAHTRATLAALIQGAPRSEPLGHADDPAGGAGG